LTGRVFAPIMAVHLPGETPYPPAAGSRSVSPCLPLHVRREYRTGNPQNTKNMSRLLANTGGRGVSHACARKQVYLFLFVDSGFSMKHRPPRQANPAKLPRYFPRLIYRAHTRARARFVICHAYIICMVNP